MATTRKPRMPAFKNLPGIQFKYGGLRVRMAWTGFYGVHRDRVVFDGREYFNVSMSYQNTREMLDGLKTLFHVDQETIKIVIAWLKWAGVSPDGTKDMDRFHTVIEEGWKRDVGLPAIPDFQYPASVSQPPGKPKPPWRSVYNACAFARSQNRMPRVSELLCEAVYAGLTAEELEALDVPVQGATPEQIKKGMEAGAKVRFLESLTRKIGK